ncbi:MAG: hypothetical protein KDA37_01620 [Planctomycetales bacterium]|nr:hypothetical protein [Planctomycetales bacterium]
MKTLPCAALLAGAAVLGLSTNCDAQYVTYYSPVVAPAPHIAYYAPAPPVVYQANYPAPVYTVARPVTVAPTVVARPVITAPAVAPVAYSYTRWRPLLGGTVTRVRYGYAPAYYGY